MATDKTHTSVGGAMSWHTLISDKRMGLEAYHDPAKRSRTDFRRDYDRMIFSSPFRRLQNKTQVFPLPGHIFVHNRLTHSLEVSAVGRSMANSVEELLRERHGDALTPKISHIGDIVACACLCHDLGNPPFGHSGEKTISTFFSEGAGMQLQSDLSTDQWADITNFEGNANSFRLLAHQFVGRREGGFAMTYSTLASIVKYPYSSRHAGVKGKFGFFTTESEAYAKVARELGIPEISPGIHARHPLTLIMEAADDICYQIMDIEDAHKLKILSTAEVTELLLGYFSPELHSHLLATMHRLDDPNEKVAYLRSKAIGALVEGCARAFADNEDLILEGKLEGPLLGYAAEQLHVGYEACSATAWDKIYRAPEVVDIEIAGNRILTSLLSVFTEAALSPQKNASRLLLAKVPAQYDIHSSDLFTRIQAVLDHISGMTDVYALDLFRKFNGHSLPAV